MSETSTGEVSAQPRLVVTLRDGQTCELRGDQIAVGSQEYALSDITWAGLVIDPTVPAVPGAPPPPALLLRLRDGRDVLLSPAEPPTAWQLLGAVFQARPDLRATTTRQWTPPPPPPPPPAYGYGYQYGYPQYGYPPAVAAPSSGDTVLAGLSHLSVFFAPVLMPLIVWLATRRSSPYSSRQAKQAFFFHLVFFALQILLFAGLFALPLVFFSATPSDTRSANDLFFLSIYVFWGVYLVAWLIQVIFSIIGAVKAFQGKPFHYPLLGWL